MRDPKVIFQYAKASNTTEMFYETNTKVGFEHESLS